VSVAPRVLHAAQEAEQLGRGVGGAARRAAEQHHRLRPAQREHPGVHTRRQLCHRWLGLVQVEARVLARRGVHLLFARRLVVHARVAQHDEPWPDCGAAAARVEAAAQQVQQRGLGGHRQQRGVVQREVRLR